MLTVNIRDAKTNLSKLVDRAAKGEGFIIAKAGKPLVKVMAIEQTGVHKPRIGFMKGWISAPRDFDELSRGDIAELFDDAR